MAWRLNIAAATEQLVTVNLLRFPQDDSKLAISCVRFRLTVTDVKIHYILSIRRDEIYPRSQPGSNQLDARPTISIRRQDLSTGKIENGTTVVGSIILVGLIAGRNSEICSGLRSDPRCYPVVAQTPPALLK
jgi:hypothetical protein